MNLTHTTTVVTSTRLAAAWKRPLASEPVIPTGGGRRAAQASPANLALVWNRRLGASGAPAAPTGSRRGVFQLAGPAAAAVLPRSVTALPVPSVAAVYPDATRSRYDVTPRTATAPYPTPTVSVWVHQSLLVVVAPAPPPSSSTSSFGLMGLF